MIIPGEQSGTLGAAEAVVTVGIEEADHVVFQVTGTWVGTITPEVSVNGTDWVAQAVKSSAQVNATTLITSFTGNGISALTTVGVPHFRVRMSAYTSGTANVIIHADRIAK
jgi:hypothetical protein